MKKKLAIITGINFIANFAYFWWFARYYSSFNQYIEWAGKPDLCYRFTGHYTYPGHPETNILLILFGSVAPWLIYDLYKRLRDHIHREVQREEYLRNQSN